MLPGSNKFRHAVPNVLTGQVMMENDHTHPGLTGRSTRFRGDRLCADRTSASGAAAAGTVVTGYRAGAERPVGRAAPRCLCYWLVCMLLASGSPVVAQRMDSFEGGNPRWQLVESDCQAQLTEHEISLLNPHNGRTCEMFEMATGSGRLALLAYPIEPCVVLDEFQPRIWTRCSSGRIQLGVRVVFPMAEHPITLGRLTTIVWGDFYRDTGQWQMLEVRDMKRRFQEEVVALRQRFGADLQLDGAYIDCLVLNAYTGPGRYRVQVDDLDLRGMIPTASMGVAPPTNWRERWRWRHVTPSAEDRFWVAPNRPPVWLHYQGEPVPWLQSLGVTGLVLGQLPSEPQLARIRDAGLSVISPPPTHPLVIDEELAPVLKGWLVGAALDSRQTDLARAQARLATQLPEALQRPLVGEALEQTWLFSRIADEVIVPAPAAISAGTTLSKYRWLTQQLQTSRQRGQGWVSLNVGETQTTLEQYRAAESAIAATPSLASDDAPANPLGLRHQATSAIMAGARGIVYRAVKPLDMQGAGDSAMIAAMRWINNDLTVWGPWIMAGQPAPAPQLSRAEFQAAAWAVADSRLILVQTMDPAAQYCLPPTRSLPLEVSLSAVAKSPQVLRLTLGSLERVTMQATPAGVSWRVENPAPIEVFVVTDQPAVLGHLRRRQEATAVQNAADQLEIVAYNLSVAADIIEARFPSRDESRETAALRQQELQRLAAAQRQLDQGWQALRSQQPRAATRAALDASDLVQAMQFDAQQTAVSNLATPQASPFAVSPGLLSYHWRLADACSRSQWRELPLPGAQLANLSDLLQAGWSQQRRLEERVDLRVEIVPHNGPGSGGLRMAAYRKTTANDGEPIPGGYEGASLRVRSAAAEVRAGQLVRVSATARILRASQTPESGLLVYDNQAGPSLGQLVQGAAGDVVPVELYRFAIQNGEFRILAECRGECDIVLDSVHASVIEPATDRHSYPTSRNGSLPMTIIGDAGDAPIDSAGR